MSHQKENEETYPEGVPEEDRPERFVEHTKTPDPNESGDQSSAVDAELVPSEPEPDDESDPTDEETPGTADGNQ